MDQTTQPEQPAQPATTPPADPQVPQNAQTHVANAHDLVTEATDVVESLLSGDEAKFKATVQNAEKTALSLALDLVPPTYRAKAQTVVDAIVNQPSVSAFVDKEAGIGFAIARARLKGVLDFIHL